MSLSADDYRSFENQMHGWAALPGTVQPDWTAATPEVVEFCNVLIDPPPGNPLLRALQALAFNQTIQDLINLYDSLGRLLGGPPANPDNLDEEIRTSGNIFDLIAGRTDLSLTDLLAYLQQRVPLQLSRLWVILAAFKRLTGSTLGLADLLDQLRTVLTAFGLGRFRPPLIDPGQITGPAKDLFLGIIGAVQGLLGGAGNVVGGLLQVFSQGLSVNQIQTGGLGAGSSISLTGSNGAPPTVGKFVLSVTPGPGASKPQTITVSVNVPPDLLAAWKAQPLAYVTVFDQTTGQSLNVQGVVTWTDGGYTVTFDNPSSITPVLQNGHTYLLNFFFIG